MTGVTWIILCGVYNFSGGVWKIPDTFWIEKKVFQTFWLKTILNFGLNQYCLGSLKL